jgi:hypothetical protein
MFASALVAGCAAFACQAGRSEVMTTAARYSELLVHPTPQTPPVVSCRAKQFSELVRCIQGEAWRLWVLRAQGAGPEEEGRLINLLQIHRDAAHAELALESPHGIVKAYGIQSALLDALECECKRAIDAANARGRPYPTLAYYMKANRGLFRTDFALVLARVA